MCQCLLKCLEDPAWQLNLAALHCLEVLTSCLLDRIRRTRNVQFSAHQDNNAFSNGHPLSRYHQDIEEQLEHTFLDIPPEPVDQRSYSSLSANQLSVQEYISALLLSPLPSSSIISSPKPSVRTAACKILNDMLSILELSIDFEVLWMTYREQVDVVPPEGGRKSSGEPCPYQDNSHAVDDSVQELVAAIAHGIEEMSQCMIGSHEERWLCESFSDLQHHCSVFALCMQSITRWLHSLTKCSQGSSTGPSQVVITLLFNCYRLFISQFRSVLCVVESHNLVFLIISLFMTYILL